MSIFNIRLVFPYLALILFIVAYVYLPAGNVVHAREYGKLSCDLSLNSSSYFPGQVIDFGIKIINKSSETKTILWPENFRFLQEWGVFTISIQGENGKQYYEYVPSPGPILIREKKYYIALKYSEHVTQNFNVCAKNIKHETPPCVPGKYIITARYNNLYQDYWENNQSNVINNTWIGELNCNKIQYEIISK